MYPSFSALIIPMLYLPTNVICEALPPYAYVFMEAATLAIVIAGWQFLFNLRVSLTLLMFCDKISLGV